MSSKFNCHLGYYLLHGTDYVSSFNHLATGKLHKSIGRLCVSVPIYAIRIVGEWFEIIFFAEDYVGSGIPLVFGEFKRAN